VLLTVLGNQDNNGGQIEKEIVKYCAALPASQEVFDIPSDDLLSRVRRRCMVLKYFRGQTYQRPLSQHVAQEHRIITLPLSPRYNSA
jgi:hypothetical protein